MIRLQSGDQAAFGEIVDRHERSLIGFFFHNTRDRQLSEDLTQETLLKVYNQFWDYLPLGRFRGWLFRIARNLLIDDVRRRSHDALIRAVGSGLRNEDDYDPLARVAVEMAPPDSDLQREEIGRLISNLLDEIPEDQRLTFVLHHYSDLPLAEVAEIMETTEATAKSRLRLAREKLAEKLRLRGVQPLEA
ncbi:MAG: RNA polymerase sigma factor [Planctomycetaceae bacterium]